MEKTTLKLAEFYSLEAELAGVSNRQTQEVISKGLLGEKVRLTVKYWLTDLLKKVSAEKESIDKLKEAIIKKYGTEGEGGAVSIPIYLFEKDADGKDIADKPTGINPAYSKFESEFNELLQEERELEHFAFKLENFSNVESDDNYTTFFKLIKVSE